ncbi:hypothetical protein HPB49_025275 [Dermacentor silvarum]|uniref:Uncharacterized protein n=1 Tax=Dermacentor silvarum TaxID=543639 RepID=A0ACB8D9B8_DERSI|nr:hypothetical protein HPB49_025275 [Dermacentor silvarum]
MATSSATPQTVQPSSEGCIPGEMMKKSSTTPEAELQRKERSYQDCLEFLMPIYLLPFVFCDKEGICIYCILLTVVGLVGRLLPPAVAAMLPIAILPLGGVYGADDLAAEYLGPSVLTASLLFAVAFLGDETTVFFRLCLHVIQRCALQMQPLFLNLQLVVLALSMLLPSTVIVVFSTVFIDRFVTTVHNEIIGADQRSVVRIQTASSSPNYLEEVPRPRWRRGSRVTKPGRRARSVSMVSELASEASGNSSSVKPSGTRMLPPALMHEPKILRKTSFGAFGRPWRDDNHDNEWSRCVPARRIRSFSLHSKPPSSILKRNTNTPEPSPLSSPSPFAVILRTTEEREGSLLNGTLSAPASPQPSPGREVWHDAHAQPTPVGTIHTVPSSAPSPFLGSRRKALLSGSLTCPGTADASTARNGSVASATLRPSSPNTDAMVPPTAKCPKSDEPASSSTKFRPKATAKHGRGRDVVSLRTARHRHHALSGKDKRQAEKAARPPLGTKTETRHESRRTSQPKSDTVPPPPMTAAPKHDPMPEPVPQVTRANQPRPEAKLEVRGVLKKRSPLPQRNDSLPSRSPEPIRLSENKDFGLRPPCPIPEAGSEQPATGRSDLNAQGTSLSEIKSPTEKASSSVTGAEQPTLSLRVRSRDDQCPVSWFRWLAVSLPVVVTCCAISWTSIYYTSLVSCDNSIDEQAHRDMSKCAKVRHQNMKKHTIREALLFYWLVGIPVASSAYAAQHPGRYLEGPFLGLTLLVLSTAPGPAWRRCWSLRLLCWRNLCSRMPWDIILMLGSVMALSRTVEKYRLVEVGLAKLDDHFWAQRSAKSSQFILVSVAAVLSEVVVGDSLARSMATTVVRVAVVTETPVSFYVVPVSMLASINVMMPVSLPVLIMREYLQTKCTQMLAYGVLLKCAAVVVVFISMNTIGLFMFQGDQPPTAQAIYVIRNATDADRATL